MKIDLKKQCKSSNTLSTSLDLKKKEKMKTKNNPLQLLCLASLTYWQGAGGGQRLREKERKSLSNFHDSLIIPCNNKVEFQQSLSNVFCSGLLQIFTHYFF